MFASRSVTAYVNHTLAAEHRRVRVAIVTESFLPQVNGVTNSVCRVLEHLASLGHQACVLAPAPSPPEYAGAPVWATPGVSLPWYPSFRLGRPTARVAETLRAFQPDVVHLASPVALGLSGALAARRLGVPSVAVFQTDLAGFARRNGLRGVDRAIWAWLRRLHAQADLTLAPSAATLAQLRRHGFGRLELWRRGVDAERFHPRRRDERLRRELLGPDRHVLVGYVGRLAADKQVGMLADVAKLPGVRLVVVGDGPAAPSLRRAIPSARFTGLLTGDRLPPVVASLDVFAHTGADETFCQAVQEALAAGVPVVAPAAGGPLDLVRPGGNGLLYPAGSAAGLRGAVGALAADSGLRVELARHARPSVEGNSWEKVCGELIERYRSLLPATAPAGPLSDGKSAHIRRPALTCSRIGRRMPAAPG